MDALRDLMLILHFVGLASLLGGTMVQLRSARTGGAVINPAMVHGTITQIVTGLVLTGIAEADDVANHSKVTAKTLVLAAIAVLVFTNRRRDRIAPSTLYAIAALTVANICIAVVW